MTIKGIKFFIKNVEKLKDQADDLCEAIQEKHDQLDESESMSEDRLSEWEEYLDNIEELTDIILELDTDQFE